MDEIWKDISGYEGLYQVSNLGRVRSLNYNHTGEIKLLKQGTYKKGHKCVSLFKNKKGKTYSVHRLVAIAFIPNPNNLPIINHKDEDPSNNNVNNLEWCTVAYNNTYGTARKRAGEKMRGENNPWYGKRLSEEHRKKLSNSHKGKYKGKESPVSKPILMYDKKGNFIRRFDCISDTNEYFGKKNAYKNVSSCLRGERPTAYNHIFKYENE